MVGEHRLQIAGSGLHSYERQFRLMVEAVTDCAIFMLDACGHVVTWNEGAWRMMGYEAGEIIGRDFSCFYTADDQARGVPMGGLKVARATGRSRDHGWRVRKDGSLFLADVVVGAVTDESGTLIGFSEVIRDVTETHRTQSRLDGNLRLVTEANHELRGPIQVMLTWVALLERQLDALGIEDRKALAGISRAASRLTSIIERMLDLSRMDVGCFQARPVSIEPAALVERVIEDFKVLAERKNLDIVWKNEAPGSTLEFDEYCFTHMLSNLLSNAIKFTDRGKIEVRLFRASDGMMALEVSDTGIGMEPRFVSHLFEPFAREQRKTGAAEGAGLGLAVTKRYLELNDAKVSVQTAKDAGTTFLIRFSPHSNA
ncbi:MAG TPA: PAS domain-containing sensor histidine kinase [Chloroflexota bacterium]|nr:PAS domain-containing sensor histidine kinase [Chloroflexota bacterium]